MSKTSRTLSLDLQLLAEWDDLKQMGIPGFDGNLSRCCERAMKLEMSRAKATREYKKMVERETKKVKEIEEDE